jgi:general secretion pathway protein K
VTSSRRQIGRQAPRTERGAALLSALVSVAVLTALAVDLAYQSRVSLNIAANARDELRAQYRARGGVAMGRLVLSFQQDLDKQVGANKAIPRVQLWNLVPVDQALVDGLFSGVPSAPSRFAEQERRPVPTGDRFDTVIEDEGRKVNAQFRGLISGGDQTIRYRVQSLYQLICDSRWDALFEREDANGLRSTRDDILIRLYDWADPGSAAVGINPGPGTTSAPCGLQLNQPPFADAFGDENQPYDRGDDRYRTKNAKIDSLDELYLIAGIGDAFMAAFGDSLTVYSDKINVNTTDRDQLMVIAGMVAPGHPALLDREFPDKLVKLVREATFNGILSLTPSKLGTLLLAAGVTPNQNLLADNNSNSPFTDRSNVFRIRASGKAGIVRSSIDAVVRFDDQNQKRPGDQIAVPGRLIHWREE